MSPEESKANIHKPFHAWNYLGNQRWQFTGFDTLEEAQAYAKANNSRDVSGPDRFSWVNPDFKPSKQPKDVWED